MRKRAEKIRVDCPNCGGSGSHSTDRDTGVFDLWGNQIEDCGTCGGSGLVWGDPEEREFEPEDN